MNGFKKVSILTLSLIVASCNEQVSPQLGDSGLAGPPSSSSSNATTTYSFKLINTARELLNYKLHKTGAGNANAECSITSVNTPFSNTLFGNPLLQNDITCYLEAEELALYAEGLSLKIEASPNSCEWISYQPYSYFNRMPGDSSGSYRQITCANDDTTSAHVATALSGIDYDPDGPGGLPLTEAGCGQWLSDHPLLPVATRQPFPKPKNDADLCLFNYTDGDAESCDVGTITILESIVSFSTETGNVTSKSETRKVKCGGKVSNCVGGPLKNHPQIDLGGSLLTTGKKGDVLSASYEYPSLLPDRWGTYVYANFRRNLANSSIAYGTYVDPYTFPNTYTAPFIDQKTFDPEVMARYVRNYQYSGNSIMISSAEQDAASIFGTNQFVGKPLAAEAYVGLPNSNNGRSYKTNPFYTFECLDTAREPKARIRLVVRDWDRLFSSGAAANDIELITDMYKISPVDLARQDITATEPNGGFGNWDNFNDYPDWDDFLRMERDAGLLIYRPTAGFFSRDAFPNEALSDD